MSLSWVSWVLKNYELGLAGLLSFEKLCPGFSNISWILEYSEQNFAGLAGFEKIKKEYTDGF